MVKPRLQSGAARRLAASHQPGLQPGEPRRPTQEPFQRLLAVRLGMKPLGRLAVGRSAEHPVEAWW